MPRRFFVTGTDTGVGKTQVSSALLSLLAERDEQPFAYKPCESGGGDDAVRLQRAGGGWQRPETVCLYRLAAPLAPEHAARLEGVRIDWKRVLAGFRSFGERAGVVEGAGGLFVPFAGRRDVIDLIEALALPVVLVARAGLGTLNHTTLSLNALRDRGLDVAAVVLVQSTKGKDPSIPFNRPELERRFPSIPFLGPVPYLASEPRRRAALRRAVASIL